MSLALIPATSAGFEDYRRDLVESYARQKVEAGQWPSDDAPRRAEKEVRTLLPDGAASKGHHLYEIEGDSGSRVGRVWLHVPGKGSSAWIYDISIHEEFRGAGYGTRALAAVEEKAREFGAWEIGLHVFAHNTVARGLYEKSGYDETSVTMSKSL